MFAQQCWCIFAWLYHMLLSISKQWTITHLSALLEDLWCFHLFVSLKSMKPSFVQSKTNLSAHLRATNTLELWVLGLGRTLYKAWRGRDGRVNMFSYWWCQWIRLENRSRASRFAGIDRKDWFQQVNRRHVLCCDQQCCKIALCSFKIHFLVSLSARAQIDCSCW